jgi:hypothetical protein
MGINTVTDPWKSGPLPLNGQLVTDVCIHYRERLICHVNVNVIPWEISHFRTIFQLCLVQRLQFRIERNIKVIYFFNLKAVS